MENIGKGFILVGILIVCLGLFFVFGDRFPFLQYLGRLPGDIRIERENFRFYFPLTTSILVSVLLSLLIYVLGRFKL